MTESRPPVTPLGAALRDRRKAKRLSLRDLSEEIGVSFNTLSRVERGYLPDLKNFQLIVDWLGLPADNFLEVAVPDSVPTPEIIARHLQADPSLPREAVEKITELVSEMYRKLSRPQIALHLRAHTTLTPAASQLLGDILGDMQETLSAETGN